MKTFFSSALTFLLLAVANLKLQAQSDSVFQKKIAQDFCDEFDKI